MSILFKCMKMVLVVVTSLGLFSCSDDTQSTSQSAGFPSKLTINSPTSIASSGTVGSAPKSHYKAASVIQSEIESVLADPSKLSTTLDMQKFYSLPSDENSCYGPIVDYVDHIDDPAGTQDGQLPPGDLGIWIETISTGEACAAAQLNSQILALEEQTSLALAVLAAMKASYDSTGSADISSYLPSTVTLTSQSFTLDTVNNLSDYSIVLAYDTNSDGTDEAIEINLKHFQNATDSTIYEGLLTIQAANVTNGGNCSSGGGNVNITQYTSVHYVENSSNDLRVQTRTAGFCGSDSTSIASHNAFSEPVSSVNTLITGNVLNPDAVWADNFRIFTAVFDPTPDSSGELSGRYSYSWQAGNQDSNTRILDVGLSAGQGGESYFGFGDKVQDVTTINGFGIIKGMICNWAGPGNNHTLQPYAQRQHLTLNTSLSIYEPTNSAASDITYAPTTNCTYDGSGTFTYDRNLNSLQDEASTVLLVGVGYGTAGTGLEFDLLSVGSGRTDIWDTITTDRGYQLPAYPK